MVLKFDNFEIDFQEGGDFRYKREVKGMAEVLDVILYTITKDKKDLVARGWDPLILTDLKQMLVNSIHSTLVGNFLVLLNDPDYEARWQDELIYRDKFIKFENETRKKSAGEQSPRTFIIKGKEVELIPIKPEDPPLILPTAPSFRMTEVDALTWLELNMCPYLGEKTKEQIKNLKPSKEDLIFFMEVLNKIISSILSADIKRHFS